MMRMSMKMAAVSTISLLLLCCVAISLADSQDGCDYNAIKGKDFTVPLSSKLEPYHQLKWRHNNTVIVVRRTANVFVVGNNTDVSKNGSLLLKNLKDSDNGIYTAELFTSSRPATPVLANIAPNSTASSSSSSSSIPELWNRPELTLSPAPDDFHRPHDKLKKLMMTSSLLLFLSPGRKLSKYKEYDTM
ncbi:hypothetical protein EPR50_G00238110 [Perca flavescens]|uniref:Immunoglobulin V-set domain-containing protein n=1 Tax=Perca flavescens TaxID=8167 RepID=A0A484BYF5_PERFV|nr:hypothetical protein EPR50_G00238110 [Perca flavescens]